MVRVTVGNNVKRDTVIVESTDTIREILENAEIDYTRGAIHLDGAPLQPGDMDRSLADFGITERCFLLNVQKADNA